MGYRVLLLSAASGFGIERLRRTMHGCESAVVGQSGVGKSSLLNAVETGLHLRVGAVSVESRKGRHTTTTAELLPLSGGGYVVDTPGMRQFQLWDVVPQEIAGYFRDLRPFVSRCRFPGLHAHARGGVRREERRGRRPDQRTALRKLLPVVSGGLGVRRRDKG